MRRATWARRRCMALHGLSAESTQPRLPQEAKQQAAELQQLRRSLERQLLEWSGAE